MTGQGYVGSKNTPIFGVGNRLRNPQRNDRNSWTVRLVGQVIKTKARHLSASSLLTLDLQRAHCFFFTTFPFYQPSPTPSVPLHETPTYCLVHWLHQMTLCYSSLILRSTL